MIQDLFETHIEVSNLDVSRRFYSEVLALIPAHVDETRRIAFFWIGVAGKAMLGLWERPEVHPRHFAFRCDKDWILKQSVAFLESHQLKPYNFLKDKNLQPMVFGWMPAIAIYFRDPDENELEFISMLEGKPRPEKGVLAWEEWVELNSEND